MATEQEYRSILIPNQPFRRLKIADYISQGKKKKLFKGEYIRTSAKTIDDLYYYYIDEGQIVATFEQESGEVAPLYWRNAGNAFSAEYNDYASIGRYKARFIAAQNTVLFAFTQRQLYELSQDDPELFYEFINVCHMSFAQMGHRISNTGHQSSTKRMIMWLQKLCATQECDEHGVYDIGVQADAATAVRAAVHPHYHLHEDRGGAGERGRHRAHAHAHPHLRCPAPRPIRPRGHPAGVLIAPMARSRACDLKERVPRRFVTDAARERHGERRSPSPALCKARQRIIARKTRFSHLRRVFRAMMGRARLRSLRSRMFRS